MSRAASRSKAGKPRQQNGRMASRSKRAPVDIENLPFEVTPPPKKKKKKKETFDTDYDRAIDTFKTRFEGALESDDTSELESVFLRDYGKIKKMLDPDNATFRIDQVTSSFFRASLSTILDLLPIAEIAYRKHQKESAAYALTALINQARDLTNDVKMGDDVDGQIMMMQQLVKQSYRGLLQLFLQEKYALQEKLMPLSTSPGVRRAMRDEVDAMVRSFGKAMTEYETLTADRISAFMAGDPNYMNPRVQVDVKPVKKKRKRPKHSET